MFILTNSQAPRRCLNQGKHLGFSFIMGEEEKNTYKDVGKLVCLNAEGLTASIISSIWKWIISEVRRCCRAGDLLQNKILTSLNPMTFCLSGISLFSWVGGTKSIESREELRGTLLFKRVQRVRKQRGNERLSPKEYSRTMNIKEELYGVGRMQDHTLQTSNVGGGNCVGPWSVRSQSSFCSGGRRKQIFKIWKGKIANKIIVCLNCFFPKYGHIL